MKAKNPVRIDRKPRPKTETIAYAYRGGQIGFITPPRDGGIPEGTLLIARGDADLVRATVSSLARRAYDNETLIVPGCPEAKNEIQALDAFKQFAARVQSAMKRDAAD